MFNALHTRSLHVSSANITHYDSSTNTNTLFDASTVVRRCPTDVVAAKKQGSQGVQIQAACVGWGVQEGGLHVRTRRGRGEVAITREELQVTDTKAIYLSCRWDNACICPY